MNQIVSAPTECNAATPRRDFLRSSLLLAVPAVLGSAALPAAAAGWTPKSRARGNARVNVRDFGARGNGSTDDTGAIQRAINALPGNGGTVYIPAGTYMIDAERSIRLRSRMHLQLDNDAKLKAKPTSSHKYDVVLADEVHAVEISGGQIIGERHQHRGTSGEYGMGIRIRGCEWVTVRDIRLSDCWGDGITVGPKPVWRAPYIMSRDVDIDNIVCTGNRRNGLSIGNAIDVKVYNSEFSDTHGTTPECGIDIEPSPGPNGDGYCDNVVIDSCLFRNNAKMGLMMWTHAQGVKVRYNVMENNVCGVFIQGAENVNFWDNTIRNSRSTGMAIRKTCKHINVRQNTFRNNYTKQGPDPRSPFSLVGAPRKVEKDINVSNDVVDVWVALNHYR